jgi:predicted glycosyltransferase
MADKVSTEEGLPEIAFYYPGPIWYNSDWVKNLILFFDGVGLLVPTYMKERPERIDPIMASPLRELGLLHILEPETLIDKAATEQLTSAMTDIITSGMLDGLAEEGTAFHELSYSRLGSHGDCWRK